MFSKIRSCPTIKPPFFCHASRKPALVIVPQSPPPAEPMRIVYSDGFVEYYYMAVPASGTLKKNPSAMLARPDVFQRPWESIVRSDEILIPGEKYYVVPRRTIQKLRHRSRQTMANSAHDASEGSSVSEESEGESSQKASTSSEGRKTSSNNGTGCVNWRNTNSSSPIPAWKRKKKKKAHTAVFWRPTLTVIDEKSAVMELLPPPS